MKITLDTKLKMSDAAIQLVSYLGNPYITEGFAGYLMELPKKFHAVFIATMGEFGQWFFASTRPGKDLLTKRELLRAVRYLVKVGMLEEDLDVFPEYRPHLEWKSRCATILKVSQDLTEVEDSFQADDGLEGLENFMEDL